ncbi:hypothetical protein SeMB42_g01376 [Synchytrium endobioticum]|uniref:Uncharacterized protein n=1 Tax=Synchytrium endobioticum TaxID=286115 RepID=A0A507DMN6_9FUNG|nr:hypothetical protein SeMB42_g01376 [Synchytrium endobioticum]
MMPSADMPSGHNATVDASSSSSKAKPYQPILTAPHRQPNLNPFAAANNPAVMSSSVVPTSVCPPYYQSAGGTSTSDNMVPYTTDQVSHNRMSSEQYTHLVMDHLRALLIEKPNLFSDPRNCVLQLSQRTNQPIEAMSAFVAYAISYMVRKKQEADALSAARAPPGLHPSGLPPYCPAGITSTVPQSPTHVPAPSAQRRPSSESDQTASSENTTAGQYLADGTITRLSNVQANVSAGNKGSAEEQVVGDQGKPGPDTQPTEDPGSVRCLGNTKVISTIPTQPTHAQTVPNHPLASPHGRITLPMQPIQLSLPASINFIQAHMATLEETLKHLRQEEDDAVQRVIDNPFDSIDPDRQLYARSLFEKRLQIASELRRLRIPDGQSLVVSGSSSQTHSYVENRKRQAPSNLVDLKRIRSANDADDVILVDTGASVNQPESLTSKARDPNRSVAAPPRFVTGRKYNKRTASLPDDVVAKSSSSTPPAVDPRPANAPPSGNLQPVLNPASFTRPPSAVGSEQSLPTSSALAMSKQNSLNSASPQRLTSNSVINKSNESARSLGCSTNNPNDTEAVNMTPGIVNSVNGSRAILTVSADGAARVINNGSISGSNCEQAKTVNSTPLTSAKPSPTKPIVDTAAQRSQSQRKRAHDASPPIPTIAIKKKTLNKQKQRSLSSASPVATNAHIDPFGYSNPHLAQALGTPRRTPSTDPEMRQHRPTVGTVLSVKGVPPRALPLHRTPDASALPQTTQPALEPMQGQKPAGSQACFVCLQRNMTERCNGSKPCNVCIESSIFSAEGCINNVQYPDKLKAFDKRFEASGSRNDWASSGDPRAVSQSANTVKQESKDSLRGVKNRETVTYGSASTSSTELGQIGTPPSDIESSGRAGEQGPSPNTKDASVNPIDDNNSIIMARPTVSHAEDIHITTKTPPAACKEEKP